MAALSTTTLAAVLVMTMTSGAGVSDGFGDAEGVCPVNGVGTEVAVWDPVRGIPPSVFHPVLLVLLVLVAPMVIGWLFSDGYLDCVVTTEWWRIVTFDTIPAIRGYERVRIQQMLAFGYIAQFVCLAVLVRHGCNPPQKPHMVGLWRHQVDLIVGVFVMQWLLSHAVAWGAAVDVVEARRGRMRRRQAAMRRSEQKRAQRNATSAVERTGANMRSVARSSRRLRRDKIRVEDMSASDGNVGGAAGRTCGRGGGRVGGRKGLRSASAAAETDPIQAAWDLDTECFRRLNQVMKVPLEMKELREMEVRAERAMLKLDAMDISQDDEDRRGQRKGALMALEATAQHIEALVMQAEIAEAKDKTELTGLVN